ncbi:hypothetical protein SAMN04488565_1975 [Leucobacter chromiiresistens]|uniref:Uncharacterized protein n=2 Tax=Leucobacter chromiiresistens TaxID=1079994 RepID=A0A1H0ZQN7_9MICO|nr:hypothetical protein SAMN04488565_1975 [Leucobacter chromiiresistens]
MRDLGETGAMDLSEIGEAASDAPQPEAPAARPATEADIEISPFHPDGTPRSRREMRQLREEALAELAARSGGSAAAGAAADGESFAAGEPVVAEQTESGDETPAEPETPAAANVAEPKAPAQEPETPEQEPETPAQVIEEPVVPEPEAPIASGDPVSEEPASDEPDFDTLMSPPTEPFTVEELREAESSENTESSEQSGASELAARGEGGSEAAEHVTTGEPDAEPTEATVEPEETDAPVKSKRRFPWQRSKQAEEPSDETGEAAHPVAAADATATGAPETAVLESIDAEPIDAGSFEAETAPPASAAAGSGAEDASGAPETEPVIAELVDESTDQSVARDERSEAETTVLDAAPAAPAAPAPADAPEDLPTAPPETTALPAQGVDTAPSAEEASAERASTPGAERTSAGNPQQRENYSFPDIAPPEEWRSVFDDPSGREFPARSGNAQNDGDFDDLISRAVAQEGSTSSTGTSALILPSMPEDTGGLTGPLGATGDLYVTGSLKLPKSLGETGGHSALHDSIEMDPITGDHMPHRDDANEGPAPVSARHAVSARVDSGIPVVAKPTREKSKLPLVLSLTGGGLLIVVVGLGAWGASNGFFG